MKTSYDLIFDLLGFVTDPQPVWSVTQWRGTTGGYRLFGSDLNRHKAEKRAQLVARLFPEYSNPKVIDDTYGM
jgi:hypothetical protein